MKKILIILILPIISFGIYDIEWFDLNHWRCPFTNDGRLGVDVSGGIPEAGATWPQPLRNFYIYGAGIWIGTIVNNETLVTFSYCINSGGTEMYPTLCRYWRQPLSDSDRIYKYPGDWPPPRNRFPLAPQEPRSQMDLWMCFSDSNPQQHQPPGRPLGMDVYLTVYGFSDSIAQDIFILKYQLVNSSGFRLNPVYVGIIIDADIGSYRDDMAGLILNKLFQIGSDTFRIKNVGFFYDYDNIEPPSEVWERGTPGTVAIRLLKAPNNLNLTAFKKWTIEEDPVEDKARYLTLLGYNHLTGEYEPYDSIDETPGDKRGLLSCGPFEILPDSIITLYFAVIGSPYGDSGQGPQGRDTSQLALRCFWAEQVLERILAIEEEKITKFDNKGTFIPSIWKSRVPFNIPMNENLSIYDISGSLIKRLPGRKLRDKRELSPGIYFIHWEKKEQIYKIIVY